MFEKKALTIIVDGPHGCGKSESLKFLYLLLTDRGLKVRVCPELFAFPDERFYNVGNPQDVVGFANTEFLFFTNFIERCMFVKEHENDCDVILLDRSAKSLKIYLDWCGDERLIGGLTVCFNRFRKLVLETEDIVFYLQLSLEENIKRIRRRYDEFPERKKWKEDDENYLKSIHYGYENYLKHDWNVKTIDVTKKDKEKTAKAILKELDLMGLLRGGQY